MLKGGQATLLKGSPPFVGGLTWHKGALYVSGGTVTKKGIAWQLQAWSGWNGKQVRQAEGDLDRAEGARRPQRDRVRA